MKLEKAIEILEIETSSRHEPLDPELFQAQRLGIEALKLVQHIPLRDIRADRDLLPGETLPEVIIVSDQPGESHPVVKGETEEENKGGDEMVVCIWCGEPLKFIPGRGWVHQDGSIYKQKLVKTDRHPEGELVDDHCALPKRS